ncbi:putative hydrolase [Gordonia araii NBRC 100433]|uniref:Putative hydrolase n=1 Tax=Gordonia araii NBRC 100433 TaxID=1073574 RepID=G7H2E6_9ACTN|nr:alpha/beta fold hydrolase [Gordonia araii]NNG97559.1 alpha/beta fold hydrolase [Gordonia araii NBRC 100433]GAB10021.1 putative hydrolase [Gordonia araii NBRC 100433]
MSALHLETFGPRDPSDDSARPDATTAPLVLALHGLTGHGRRWARLARDLPSHRIVAPDLLGHGESSWEPPWSYEANLTALDSVVAELDSPFTLVGHSFGGALAIRLAQRHPEQVRALVLLDPAQGLAPDRALEIASASMAHWTYPSPDVARDAKRGEGWAEVPDDILDEEIAAHLRPSEQVLLPAGRYGWRVSQPAAATAWSEMATGFELPPAGLPTDVVVADRVDPPLVSAEFLDACREHRADSVRIHHADCEHMVPFLAPGLVARLVRGD